MKLFKLVGSEESAGILGNRVGHADLDDPLKTTAKHDQEIDPIAGNSKYGKMETPAQHSPRINCSAGQRAETENETTAVTFKVTVTAGTSKSSGNEKKHLPFLIEKSRSHIARLLPPIDRMPPAGVRSNNIAVQRTNHTVLLTFSPSQSRS